MTLPNWKALPVRTKRSRKRLHNVIATEFSLDSWTELPNPIKRSKRKLFNYYAEELHLEEFKELLKQEVRSTRVYYNYLKENANPSSAPTLTITVKSSDSAVSGASVTIGSTTKSTGSDGKTTFTLDYDDYLVEVSKSGYFDYEENIKFRANHKSFTLNIEAEPVTTGTVTITPLVDSQAVDSVTVILCDENKMPSQQDDSMVVAFGLSDEGEYTVPLNTYDTSTHQPTDDPNIPFGTYYLFANYEELGTHITYAYNGTLTVDGDEEVTITLIEAGGK